MTVTKLKEISIYPIKSSAGISLSTSWVDNIGLPFDRRFVLSDHSGQFITARTQPNLCLIKTNITELGLTVSAPDMPILEISYQQCLDEYQHVAVWKDTILAQRCAEKVDAWFSNYIGKPCHLLYFGEQSRRVVTNTNKPVAFADGYPLLLISQASLDDLNSRLASPVSMSQFRPNIVVNNCEAFEEDTWQHIRIGEVEFEISKPCSRCVFTTINPETAEKHKKQEPLATLKSYRQVANGDVMFGQNLIPLNKGQINVGDEIKVLKSQSAPIFSSVRKKEPAIKNIPVNANKNEKVNILFDSWDTQVKGDTLQTVLEQGERAGLILPYSCRAGMCGSCKVKLESGEVEVLANDGLTDDEQQQGFILACSCIPKTDIVVNRG